MNQGLFRVVATALVLGFLTISGPARAASCVQAKAFVQKVADDVTRAVANTAIGSRAREARFRRIFNSSMDVPKLSTFALGRYARKIPPAKKRQYRSLVEQLVVKVFFARLKNYRGQKFRIASGRRGCRPKGSRGSEFIVSGNIVNASGRSIVQIDWWLVRGGRRVFDIAVEGVWLAQQQRSAFTSVLARNKGNFDALLANLRTRIARRK